jgi:hypothetical protein
MEDYVMMRVLVVFVALIGGTIGMLAITSEPVQAVVYCEYIDYPANCVVRPGVRLVARPGVRASAAVGVGAPGVGVRAGTPTNRGGPVDRAGRR